LREKGGKESRREVVLANVAWQGKRREKKKKGRGVHLFERQKKEGGGERGIDWPNSSGWWKRARGGREGEGWPICFN